ncbi:hypothetical protein C0989_000742 [Termitomyces sp. Mn162]|nr:hypothetical protein C0989_000742 [Termitomyces sp. Mn162]
MVLAPDNLPAHLTSHTSTTLLLHTTLLFSDNPFSTLVDSSATDNFINESLAVLAPQLLRCLPAPIPLKLFNGDPTPTRDITHCLETTMTFANGWQQELRLLVTKLHPSASVLPTLINSGISSTFISSQLNLQYNNLDKLLKLQLFDRSSTTTRITQYHDTILTLDNDLQLQAWLLITQLPLLTPIVLGLLWLQDVNPDMDWKNLTIQFPSPKASLAATIPLCLQSSLDSDISDSSASTSRAIQSSLTSNSDPNGKENSTTFTLTSTSINSGNLDIKIIGAIPFACILQDGTPAFQLQIMPALLEEHLWAGTTMLESKTEEQILSEVVPPEYHEFANVFSEGSAKELSLHHSYDHKINLKESASPLFGKIYNMSEIKL